MLQAHTTTAIASAAFALLSTIVELRNDKNCNDNLSKGRYTRGIAVVPGITVMLVFSMILIVAAPGKEMLLAHGANGSNPVSGLSSIYSAENLRCAFNAMSCDNLP